MWAELYVVVLLQLEEASRRGDARGRQTGKLWDIGANSKCTSK
jgi:hypothetical protein